MKTPLIGVLGCGGALGRTACAMLSGSYSVRGGQRSQPEGMGNCGNFQWTKVDLYQEGELAAFCQGCDVILNCAGPSYVVGDRVALAAAKANAIYIDTFGASPLEQSLLEKGLEKESVFVIAAGSFPGLSGILPRWLAAQYFDSVVAMVSLAGGREHCSPCAGMDLLLSSVSNYGIPGAFLRNKAVIRAVSNNKEKVYIPFLKEEVYQQSFLSHETIKLSQLLQLEEAYWYNIVVDKVVNEAILASCAKLSANCSEATLQQAIGELCAAADMALCGTHCWYVMASELEGKKQGKHICKRCVLRCNSSYGLSGMIAAAAVETVVAHKIKPGIYWAFELLDPVEIVERLMLTGSVRLDIVDIPSLSTDDGHNQMEEGTL